MKITFSLNEVLRKILAPLVFLCSVVTLVTTSAADARPITYTGFTITDGQLGQWKFHNARVYLSLESDTDNVQFFQPPVDPTDPTSDTVDTYINSAGKASVTIISAQRVVRATFAPGQVFVSLDLGDTLDAPHLGGRGVGFGSFSATAPGGIEPAYPLGIEDGTIDWGDIGEDGGMASSALAELSTDLEHDVAFSGRAWVCLGFPDYTCPAPTTPLKTNRGDLYLYQPYQLSYIDSTGASYPDDSLSAGFFIADASRRHPDDVPASALKAAKSARASSSPIIYHAYVISDVVLGRQRFSGAQVYLWSEADAATVQPFTDGGADGYVNKVGDAHVRVVSQGRSMDARFAPNQLYVFYDVAHSTIGFGSYAGGVGYPLSLTDNEDPEGLTENSTLGAVSDLTRGQGGTDYSYSAATAELATDLTNATALSGAASSCVSLDTTTSTCSNLTPTPLHTNRGDFFLFEPYTADDTTTDGSQPHTVNWGLFWAEPAPHRD